MAERDWSEDLGPWTDAVLAIASVQELEGVLKLIADQGGDLDGVADAALALIDRHRLGQLVQSERSYRQLTEGAPDIVFALDRDGHIAYVNDRARTVTGFEPDSLIGRHLHDVVRPEDRPVVDLHLRDLHSGGVRALFTIAGLASDGSVRHLDVSLAPLGGPDNGCVGIARDTTERRERERALAASTTELLASHEERERMRELVALVIQAQEDERARIAGDLHDTTVQTLTAIGRRLRSMADAAREREEEQDAPAALSDELDELAQAALDEAVGVRRLSRNLRPSVLDHLGLAAGLRHLADGLRESGIDVATTVDGDARALGDRERTALFRIAQEAMTNIRRHSRAGHVEVELIVRPKEALLVIRDDGVGFAVDAPALRPSASSSRLGLAGMHERAAMLGGTLELSSAAGSGTCVRAAIPLDPGTGPRDPHRGAT